MWFSLLQTWRCFEIVEPHEFESSIHSLPPTSDALIMRKSSDTVVSLGFKIFLENWRWTNQFYSVKVFGVVLPRLISSSIFLSSSISSTRNEQRWSHVYWVLSVPPRKRELKYRQANRHKNYIDEMKAANRDRFIGKTPWYQTTLHQMFIRPPNRNRFNVNTAYFHIDLRN